jgi:glycosyltransferase involved in cell wall biosynthesis
MCVHNEEEALEACLERLSFADEIVVVLDKCTDGSKAIAERFTDRIVEGAWEIEGDRRNTAIEAARGPWILEVDADERVPAELAAEIAATVATSEFDWHHIPVDNYVGDTLVRHGWGASFGRSAYPGLFRKGAKTWGRQRVHPSLTFEGRQGAPLANRIDHYVDRNISDMIRRLDRYTSRRAADLRQSGDIGSLANNIRRIFSRFFKCYVSRKGYREGPYGILIALCAGLYPLLSYLKARLEAD